MDTASAVPAAVVGHRRRCGFVARAGAAEGQVQAFLQQLAARRASMSLQLQASRTLAELLFHLGENGLRDVREVQERHLAAFARMLRERIGARGTPLALNTEAAYLQRVRSFFAFLVRRGLLLVDPARALGVPTASALPRTVLSPRQAERLMNAPSAWSTIGKRDRVIIETFYGTGLRRGERARLEVSDVNLREGTLLVRDGNGKRDRLVPIPHRAALALDRYLRDVRPGLVRNPAERGLFLTVWRGRRLSEMALVAILRTHAQAAGLPRLHPHVLRHTCATHLLQGGASVRHVQAILGHKRLKTTALYTRVDAQDLMSLINRCHPRQARKRGPWRRVKR